LRFLPGSELPGEAIVAILGVVRSMMTRGGGRFPTTAAIVTSAAIGATLLVRTIANHNKIGAFAADYGNRFTDGARQRRESDWGCRGKPHPSDRVLHC
jgi:hypothetical protein